LGAKQIIHRMKDSANYEHRQSADRMEAVLLVASVAGVVTSLFVLLSYGWLLGVLALLLSVVVFALAQLFGMIGELLGRISRVEKIITSTQRGKE
jgi:ABC-type multidrug transport system fused ATPase/permease subunit